jgi:hypothetical protein
MLFVMLSSSASCCSIVALRDAADRQIMRETGVETIAEVTRLWRVRRSEAAWVAYRFEVDGRTHEGHRSLVFQDGEPSQPDRRCRSACARPERSGRGARPRGY